MLKIHRIENVAFYPRRPSIYRRKTSEWRNTHRQHEKIFINFQEPDSFAVIGAITFPGPADSPSIGD